MLRSDKCVPSLSFSSLLLVLAYHLQVTVVAQVMSVQAQQMNTVVYVDDGTGRIEARLWNGPDDVNELEQYGDM